MEVVALHAQLQVQHLESPVIASALLWLKQCLPFLKDGVSL